MKWEDVKAILIKREKNKEMINSMRRYHWIMSKEQMGKIFRKNRFWCLECKGWNWDKRAIELGCRSSCRAVK